MLFPLGNHLYGSIYSSVQYTKYEKKKKESTLHHFLKKYFLFTLHIIEIQ